MSSFLKNFFVGLSFFILGWVLNWQYLGETLGQLHSWAQFDYYALAKGFQLNQFNFIKPQTFVYNHQFPHNFQQDSGSTITAAGFPILSYVVALLFTVFGDGFSPYQLLTLLISSLGGLYIYRLVSLITHSDFKGIFVALFIYTTPLFFYYQFSLLPSIPAFSFFVMGWFYWEKHRKNGSVTVFCLGVALVVLAALIRTTLSIFFLILVIRDIYFLPFRFKRMFVYFIGFVGLLASFFYNQHLSESYGSVFLNHTLPAASLSNYVELLSMSFYNWRYSFMNLAHYIASIIIFFFAIYQSVLREKSNLNELNFLLLAYTFSSLVFSYFFAVQFISHDYYFIDVFYLPMLLLMILGIKRIRLPSNKWASIAMLILFLIPSLFLSSKELKERHLPDRSSLSEITINSFSDIESFLSDNGVDSEEKVAVFGAFSTNTPFVLMNRKGFSIIAPTKENIINSLKWDFKFALVQKSNFFESVISNHPDFFNHFQLIAQTKDLLLLKKDSTEKRIENFFSLEEAAFKSSFEQDNRASKVIDFEDRDSLVSGSYVFSNQEIYGMNFGITDKVNLLDLKLVKLEGNFNFKDEVDCFLIINAVNLDGKVLQTKTLKLFSLSNMENNGVNVFYTFLPTQLNYQSSNRYKLFLHKPDHKKIAISDFEIAIY